MNVRTSETHPLQINHVAAGRGLIGITFCPGKHGDSWSGSPWARNLDADMAKIVEWGATAVVTLIEKFEFDALQVKELPAAVRRAGIEWHHLPIPDQGIPDRAFELCWRYAGARIRQRLREGERVLVHCRGGLGRAGMVAARLLIEFGMSPGDAIQAVRSVRPRAIETTQQEGWVKALGMVDANADQRASKRLACLLGGALGDAVGYRVEFSEWTEIVAEYGEDGIQLSKAEGPLVVSDDTQMTLFTLEGMTQADKIDQVIPRVRDAYFGWLGTQGYGNRALVPRGLLSPYPVMRKLRAPGKTCLEALWAGGDGTVERPLNDSKGCGGVMRTAPLGFMPEQISDQVVFALGRDAAALTHGHADGYLPSGAMSLLVRKALAGTEWSLAVNDVIEILRTEANSAQTMTAIEKAAKTAPASREWITSLGAGWVGEEALAIGLCSAMVADSFEECISLAANHDGDSDSTASIAGQLFGAMHGLKVLPAESVYRLDALEPLLAVSANWEGAAIPQRLNHWKTK